MKNKSIKLEEWLDNRHLKKITSLDIITLCCIYYDVAYEDIISKKRHRIYCEPRQLSMLLCHELTTDTLVYIGSLHCRHHATVIHAINIIQQEIAYSSSLLIKYTEIKSILTKKIL